MAGIKAVEPFGEVGLEVEPLLPLQLSPAGIEQSGELGVEFEEVGLVFLGVVEFVQKRADIGESFRSQTAVHFETNFHGRGRQTPQGILEPFTTGLAETPADTFEKSFGRELDKLTGRMMGGQMKGMSQHIEITLIQTPTGITDSEAIDRGDGLPFDCSSPSPLDNAEQGRAKTKIGNTASLFRPGRNRRVVAEGLYFCLKLRRKSFEKIAFPVFLLHDGLPEANGA